MSAPAAAVVGGAHSARARRALAHLPEADPALAALALWCAHRDGEGALPARTEGEVIVYGAAFATLPLREQVGILGHHVLHVALRHGARMAALAAAEGPGFDAILYNLAADGLVNTTLEEAGHALPRPAVVLPGLLRDAGLPVTGAQAAVSAWDAESLYRALAAAGPEARGRLGAEAERAGFVPDLAPGGTGRETPSASARAEAAWRARLARAAEAGRRAGRGIAARAGGLPSLPPPQVPWERRLRRLAGRALWPVPRRSHRRPDRAWIAMEAAARTAGGPVPVFQPGRSADGLRPRIVVGLDTSGSVGEALLARLAAEIDAIARRTGAETHLLVFDTQVHRAELLRPGGLAAALAGKPLRRGGGTDFAPVIAAAVARAASVVVILTDLDGPAGPAPPLPVVWAVPGAAPARAAPFGHLLPLEPA